MIDILNDKWHKRFIGLAKHISNWSEDTSTKTGAVIVNKKSRIKSLGFNGLPSGVQHTENRNIRPQKYLFYEHAERNAIYNFKGSLDDCIMYCTHFPCSDCARAIIQVGIKHVIVDKMVTQDFKDRWSDSMEASAKMFEESGVKYYFW